MSNTELNKDVVGYLVFKKAGISNANSISSPITYGFPAITGFLGAFHAMSRKLMTMESSLKNYSLGGVLLACHNCEPQVYRSSQYSNYTFNQSRNPIKKDGKTASIIEEGKCHLTMSFVVEILGDDEPTIEEQELLKENTLQWIQQQRIAGGSVHGLAKTEPVTFITEYDIDTLSPILMPAFVLIDAQDDFSEIIQQVQSENSTATPLDALLDICSLHHVPEKIIKNGEETTNTQWKTLSKKTGRGWLVPMPIGYQAISEEYAAGVMQNVRNPEYPSQYVEAIYGLGKWVYPQRLVDDFESAFWRYQYDNDNTLFLVTQEIN